MSRNYSGRKRLKMHCRQKEAKELRNSKRRWFQKATHNLAWLCSETVGNSERVGMDKVNESWKLKGSWVLFCSIWTSSYESVW